MTRSKTPYFFFALAALLAASAIFMLVRQNGKKNLIATPATSSSPFPETTSITTPPPAKTPGPTLAQPGPGIPASDPATLVRQLTKELETRNLDRFAQLVGTSALDPQTTAQLRLLFATPIRLQEPEPFREIGEIELNTRTRWAITLTDPPRQILIDLLRTNGKWTVQKLTLPTPADTPNLIPDSITTADTFLQALLHQDIQKARSLVTPATVSDAKLAGLCILFEEGAYQPRKTKPLRFMFQRQDTIGYLAYLEAPTATEKPAQFALTLLQPNPTSPWKISEINLDTLLSDYASRVSGGDIHYAPLVKNPNGGDTLALYFEFDEDQINPRTRRQLDIVTRILLSDPGKKINLSGHADALGTADYNNNLSSRRATVVRDFLTQAGVSPTQIITIAKGASQPRRPNATETGADNPQGRRANRRTEIYLDF